MPEHGIARGISCRRCPAALFSDNAAIGEDPAIEFGFPFDGSGIGARRRRHPPQTYAAPGEIELHETADRRFVATRNGTQRIGGFLPGSDDRPASRNPGQQRRQIDLAHYLKKIVRRIVFQTDDLGCGVVERNSPFAAEGLDPLLVETLGIGCQKKIGRASCRERVS